MKWTKAQKEVAALVQQGRSFSEIVESGYSKHMVSRVMAALKAGESPQSPASGKTASAQTGVAVGSLVIQPEDWRISQHGAYLLLDTYYLTKQDIGYEGSIGEFICDICQFYRQMTHYVELQEVGPALIEEGGDGESSGEGSPEEE